MELENLTQATKDGYEQWRRSLMPMFEFRPWDQLAEQQKSSYTAVAAYVVAQATGTDEPR